MGTILDATLMNLMMSEDIDTLDTRAEWMLMTWDMVSVTAEARRCVRFYLTLGQMVVTSGAHEPSLFSVTSLRIGKAIGRATSGDFPLRRASLLTEDSLGRGFSVLCRPLAVDCSCLAGQIVSDGRRIEATGDLLRGIASGSATGVETVRAVNVARAKALPTHLNPQWLDRIDPAASYDLWNALG